MASLTTLSLAGESAILAFLKVAADSEIACEQNRWRLCETHEFDPREAFEAMQCKPNKGYLSTMDLHRWLANQPHSMHRLSAEELAVIVFPYASMHGELRFEGFCRLLLPRDNLTLKELAMSRSSPSWKTSETISSMLSHRLPAEVAYRICRIFEEEIDMERHLQFHRKALREHGITARDAYRFLQTEQVVPGTGLLSPIGFRRFLVETLCGVTAQQCEALFRRINASGSGTATYEEVLQLFEPRAVSSLAELPAYSLASSRQFPESYSPSRFEEPYMSGSMLTQPEAAFRSPPRSPPQPRLPETFIRYKYEKPLDESWTSSLISPPVSPFKSKYEAASTRASTADLLSPRSPTSPAISRRNLESRMNEVSPLKSLYSPSFPTESEKGTQAVMAVIARQGELDARIEETKALLPSNTPVEAVFGVLDRYRKGHVADTDLWQFAQEVGSPVPFSGICALIREVQHGVKHKNVFSGRLSMREVGLMVLPKFSEECDALQRATCDEEVKSMLYILRFSEPCPGCGTRVQRDADAAGCPNVSCPLCRTIFRCFTVVGNTNTFWPAEADRLIDAGLPSATQLNLFRLIEASAASAEENERQRKRLQLCHVDGLLNMLHHAFSMISTRKSYFTITDLRRALFQYKHWSTERELQLIWDRYAGGSNEVNLAAFTQQLRPTVGSI